MKSAPFRYTKPDSIEDVVGLLRDHGDDAMIIAGGQSLMPMLNMRLARPNILIDINGIEDLKGIRPADGEIRIGAGTRYVELGNSKTIRDALPLIAEALPHVAHAAIRNRGTIGGSMVLADPAAELPACAVALGARFILVSHAGSRTVDASAFFEGLYQTGRREDELLTEIRVPVPEDGYATAFVELSRRQGDFALAGVACFGRRVDTRFSDLRLVFFGTDDRPIMAENAARSACEAPFTENTIDRVSDALEGDLDPMDSLHGDRGFKLHLAKVVTGRALGILAERVGL
jgi:carbon-monoxide dehydrogenase medium subunit